MIGLFSVRFLDTVLVTLSIDCKTVGFFLKISKEIGKAWGKTLTRAKRASLTRPSLALCFQPHSRPFI